MHFSFVSISLPSFQKQQREIAQFGGLVEKTGSGMPESVENTGSGGLWKTQGDGVCGKHGVTAAGTKHNPKHSLKLALGLIRPKVSFNECLGSCFIPAAVTPCFRRPRHPGIRAPRPAPRAPAFPPNLFLCRVPQKYIIKCEAHV